MLFTMNLIPTTLAIAVLAALAVFMWKQRDIQGARALSFCMFSTMAATVIVLAAVSSRNAAHAVFLLKCFNLFGSCFALTGYFLMIAQFSGNKFFSRPAVIAAYASVLFMAFLFAHTGNYYHYDYIVESHNGWRIVHFKNGPWFIADQMFLFASTGFSLYMLIKSLYESKRKRFTSTALLIFAAILPYIETFIALNTPLAGIPKINYSFYTFIIADLIAITALLMTRGDELIPIARGVVIESAPDIMLILNQENIIVDASNSAIPAIGRQRKEIIGKPVADMLSGWGEAAEFINSNAAGPVKAQATTALGEMTCMASSTQINNEDGRSIGRLLVIHDVTELEKASAEARAANMAKSEFLSNMSHEIRTPMTGILGFAELLEEIATNDEQRKYTSGLRGSTEALIGILNDVLDLSKIEGGQLALVEKPFNLRETVEQTVWLASHNAAGKSVAVLYDYSPETPAHFTGDAVRVRQILLNLLNNAVKFTDKGRATLRVSGAGPVTIEVEDTGVGMSDEEIARIFEKFYRADHAARARIDGSGLGLSVTKHLVNMMGGEIEVKSKPGKGSLFRINLPLKPGARPAAGDRDADARGKTIRPGLRALLADDNDVNLLVGSRFLEILGCRYDVARTGAEAADIARADVHDVVFMDFRMPEMDGLEATRLIREIEKTTGKKSVIIGLSASAMLGDQERCMEAGMDDFMAKPYTMAQMKAKLMEYFSDGKTTADDASPTGAPQPRAETSASVFDRTKALEYAGDDEFLKKIIESFTRQYPVILKELETAAKAGNAPEIIRAAHTLKGNFAQMGAMRASNAAQAVENAAASADSAAIKSLIAALKAEWISLLEVIDATEQ